MKAVLIVDIGSPTSTTIADVHAYLDAVYSDAFILPEVSGQSPRYSLTDSVLFDLSQSDGSSVLSRVVDRIQSDWYCPATYAYRYGEPSIGAGIQYLLQETNGQLDHIHVVPLFAQRTAFASQTIQAAMATHIKPFKIPLSISVEKPYVSTPAYYQAIAAQVRDHELDTSEIVAGFHGASPELIKKMDPSRITCLSKPNCCENPTPVSDGCSRGQAYALCGAIHSQIQPVFLDALFMTSDTTNRPKSLTRNQPNILTILPGWITPSVLQALDGQYLDAWLQPSTSGTYTRLPTLSEASQYAIISASLGLQSAEVSGT